MIFAVFVAFSLSALLFYGIAYFVDKKVQNKKEGIYMKLNEAVTRRIRELCNERGITQYQLYLKTGVPQSTLSTIMKCSYPSMKLRII